MFVSHKSNTKELHKFRGISILEETGNTEGTNSLLHVSTEERIMKSRDISNRKCEKQT